MADKGWYYLRNGERIGPVSFTELKEVVANGELGPDDLVWEQGMKDWVAARTVDDLIPADLATPPPPPPRAAAGKPFLQQLAERAQGIDEADGAIAALPHLQLVKMLLDFLARTLSAGFLDALDRNAKKVGHVAYVIGAGLFLIFYLVLAIKTDSFQLFLIALVVIVLAVILGHYIAVLFLDAGKTLLRKAPSALSSRALLVSFALLAGVGAVVYLIKAFLAFGEAGGGVVEFGLNLVSCLALLYAVGVALNPETVNVTVGEDAGAGEEAIGILMFLMKLPLRLVPFNFGLGAVLGVFTGFYFLIKVFGEQGAFLQPVAIPVSGGVLGVALLPLWVYVAFLMLYLLVDLIRSILVVPSRLERLAKK